MKKLMLTLIFVLAATSAFALPIKVGEDTVDVYASIRAYTVFTHTMTDEKALGICSRPAGKSCSQLAIGLQDNSRAGIKWTHGSFFFNNEWGITNVDAGNAQLRLRFLYGDYKFAGGEKGRIRIGQLPGIVHTSSYYDSKLSADNALQGYGTMSDVRRIGINYEIGKFSVAALSMRQDIGGSNLRSISLYGQGSRSDGTFVEIMPRIEAAYSITPDVKVAGTYVKSSFRGNDDKLTSVDAGHIMVAANPKITENIRLVASGFYSVNGGLYGMVNIGGMGINTDGLSSSSYDKGEAISRGSLMALPVQKYENDKFAWDNTKVFGGAVAIAANAFEVGFGIQSANNNAYEDNATGMGVYANYKYRISNFRITPEVGYLHSGDYPRFKGQTQIDAPPALRGLRAGVQFRFDI